MGFFDKVKDFRSMISEIENSINTGRQDYLEVYERNIELEKQIQERTTDLNLANKRMLTLQGILDIMNSAKPLKNVLETIVNSMQGDLGYLHCSILKKEQDENGVYFRASAHSNDNTVKKINKIMNLTLWNERFRLNPDGAIAKSLDHKMMVTSNDFTQLVQSSLPHVDGKLIKKASVESGCKTLISIPLYVRKKLFGVFVAFSSRTDFGDAEKDFLGLFAQQVEVVMTIAELFETVKTQAVTDSLTGLYNRRYFEEYLAKEVKRSLRLRQPFSIIGLDLDYLKKINDKYGHSSGDLAIKAVANILKNTARSIDIAARLGGEEFNILLPGIDSQGALIAAERIRKTIESQKLKGIGQITASIGVATFLEHSENVDEILELADQAMYQSKRDGRNRITLAAPVSEVSWQEIAIKTFTDILSKHNIPVDKNLSQELCNKLKTPVSVKETSKEVLYSVADELARIYNPEHSQGITKLKVDMAVSIAKRFELAKEDIDNLKVAILLYDMGNLMLPPEILQKSGPLTEEERKYIEAHPVLAARDILKPIAYVQDIIPIIEKHHENWDGSGYPQRISGNAIPMTAQIILIIDAYFALIEKRPYRAELSPREALGVIEKDAGKKWNEALVREFMNLVAFD